jgi:hypothetical protein
MLQREHCFEFSSRYNALVTCRPGRRNLRKALTSVALLSLSACTFDGSNEFSTDSDGSIEPGDIDAGETGDTPDAEPGCPFTLDALCSLGDPDGDLDFTSDEVIDTDVDSRCLDLSQGTGPEACLLWADSVSVAPGVTVIAVGSRPLVFASAQTISISGTVDASSRRGVQEGAGADFGSCALASGPQRDIGGAGGAAGGSLAGVAGNGGVGDQDSSLGFDGEGAPGIASAAVGRPTFLRGGCPGGDGADESASSLSGSGGDRGSSGGAVAFFAAESFSLEGGGSIRVTGAGGGGGEVQAGGGGGGSGGMLLIESGVVTINGTLGANGGGGGEGGVRLNGFSRTGDRGADGALLPSGAPGGTGLSFAGDGGIGSSLASLAGGVGADANGGGGGGGGSAGYIILRGAVSVNGSTSPAAIVE